MKTRLGKYNLEIDERQIAELTDLAKENAKKTEPDALKQCFSSIDLTSLNATDTQTQARQMAEKVSCFNNVYHGLPNVAAICVFPALVNTVRKNLTDASVKIAAVTAGFPSSQTYTEVKILESVMAVENGADEVDIVISLGRFLEGDYQFVFDEIAAIKKAVGKKHVKVILETGAIKDLQLIRIASLVAMEAGADFIKTSTGKFYDAATPEAVAVMCKAIADYITQSSRMVGIKPSGGIAATGEAMIYYSIIKLILGNDWLNSNFFRIGASRLANNLLTDIVGLETQYF